MDQNNGAHSRCLALGRGPQLGASALGQLKLVEQLVRFWLQVQPLQSGREQQDHSEVPEPSLLSNKLQ